MSQTWVPTQTFGTRLVMVRREKGWNIKEAARRSGIDDGSWSNWERGALPRNMASVVEAVVEATGVDRDWLMWGGDGDRFLSRVGEATAGPSTLGDAKGASLSCAGQDQDKRAA